MENKAIRRMIKYSELGYRILSSRRRISFFLFMKFRRKRSWSEMKATQMAIPTLILGVAKVQSMGKRWAGGCRGVLWVGVCPWRRRTVLESETMASLCLEPSSLAQQRYRCRLRLTSSPPQPPRSASLQVLRNRISQGLNDLTTLSKINANESEEK